MGAGSSSSQTEAQGNSAKDIKNYMDNELIQQEASSLNIETALVAYAYQK